MPYQSLVFKRITDASQDQPEWPEKFEAKFEQVIGCHDNTPDTDEFQVNQCTKTNESQTFECNRRERSGVPSIDSVSKARTTSGLAYFYTVEIGPSFHYIDDCDQAQWIILS